MNQGSSQSVKTENSVSKRIQFKRKELCPNHDLKYRYQCMNPKCEHRYLCGKEECIEDHFHNGTLTLNMFKIDHFRSKFQTIQKVINNEEKINNQLSLIRTTVENFRGQIQEIFKDLQQFQSNCQDLKNEADKTALYNYIDKYDDVLNLESKIKANIESLKVKLNKGIQEKGFHYHKMKNILEHFLKSKIKGFSWDGCNQLWSINRNYISCEKFHEKLKGKSNLLFLFIGQKCLIGSYYPDPYPSLQQKNMKSPQSFIFIHSGAQDSDFTVFKANPQSEHHLYISEKLIVCQGNTPSNGDGVRTFARNLESIDYYLPSNSYLPINRQNEEDEENHQIFSGKLTLKGVKVLQVKVDK